jgi:hypothetical protein
MLHKGAEQPPGPSCPSQEPVTAGSLREPLCLGRGEEMEGVIEGTLVLYVAQ